MGEGSEKRKLMKSFGSRILANRIHFLFLLLWISACGRQESSQTPAPANVSGVLTYYFNSREGSRADIGARAALVRMEDAKEFLEIAKTGGSLILPTSVGLSVSGGNVTFTTPGSNPIFMHSFRETSADATGRFSLERIPPGNYLLMLKSNHTNSLEIRELALNTADLVDASHDFGKN